MSEQPPEAITSQTENSSDVQHAPASAPLAPQSDNQQTQPVPHPGPRPGTRPVPRPGTVKTQPSTQDTADQPVIADPSRWGRVDADGNVWLTTKNGERQIGSWQAGNANEGLEHFARRYDDLKTEVGLLERRLETHAADSRGTRATAEKMLKSLDEATVIGDIEALSDQLTHIIARSVELDAEVKERREAEQAAAVTRKTQLAEEAEEIGRSGTRWKEAGDRLRDILAEWKGIHGAPRSIDDQLWKRFSRAREAFNRRRGAHFAELDRNKANVTRVKEDIISRAEELSSSTDWGQTANAYRGLMAEWKAAGRSQQDVDDALWKRFRAAQDTFFNARNAAFNERDEELSANGEKKSALLEEYRPRILDEKDLAKATKAFHELVERWETIGKVPRQVMSQLENGMRTLERHIADAEKKAWRRTDPEALARVQQFRDRVAQFEAQAERSERAGKTSDAQKARVQAQQWKEWADAAESAVEHR